MVDLLHVVRPFFEILGIFANANLFDFPQLQAAVIRVSVRLRAARPRQLVSLPPYGEGFSFGSLARMEFGDKRPPFQLSNNMLHFLNQSAAHSFDTIHY